MMKNIIDVLSERGILDDVTSPDLAKRAASPLTVYAGFDPSAESLQVGNFVTIMGLAHFQRCGHQVIAVVGGATGMIGDPSGKASERALLSEEQVQRNVAGIRENLSRFLDFDHPTAPARIVNNSEWFAEFSFVDFLRDVGKHFRMGSMLGKDSVRTRLNSETGMSFTEFSYQLLQAYDFLKLYDSYDCSVQLGGSDQWGNITAGTDLIRKVRGADAYGVTMPLICDSTGMKFGKSAGNAIYLDHNKTSYYEFYQFFVRTADADAIRFLRIFTFMEEDEIAELARQLEECPEKRTAQTRLAEEITRTVHGEEGLSNARRSSAVLFGDAMDGLHADEIVKVFADVPSTELPMDGVRNQPIVNVAADAGLCGSRGEARRLAKSGGLYLNNVRVGSVDDVVSEEMIVDGRIVVLRSGKRRYHIVKVV